MKKINAIRISILFITFFLVSTSLQAQDSFEILSVDYHYINAPNGDDPEFNDFNARATVPVVIRKDLFILAAPSFKRTSIEDLDFPLSADRFYRTDIPLIIQKPLSKTRGLGGLIDIGIASDFKDISGEDFTVLAGVFLSNNNNPRFTFRYGLIFSRQVNGNIVLPAFSFDWRPTDRLRFNATNPLEPDVSYMFSKKITAGLTYESGGGLYKLSEEAESRYVNDRRSELGPYADLSVTKNLLLHVQAGYTFNRKVEVFKDVDAGSTWFESFRGTDPLFEDEHQGWFFEVGLGFQIGPGN